jgi:MFS family permease
MVAAFLYFAVFAAGQLLRLVTPVALEDLQGGGDAASVTAVAFSLSGIASVAGALIIGRVVLRTGWFRITIAAGCIATAGAQFLLSVAGTQWVYVAGFAFASMTQAVLVPATNTLIASGVRRERRGTAFGIASSAQSLAFIAGPGAATLIAGEIAAGQAAIGAAFLVLAVTAWIAVREVPPEGADGATGPLDISGTRSRIPTRDRG